MGLVGRFGGVCWFGIDKTEDWDIWVGEKGLDWVFWMGLLAGLGPA